MHRTELLKIIFFGLFTVVNPAFAQTWTFTSTSTNMSWGAVACSADGTKLVATVPDGYGNVGISVSTNSGATWAMTSAPDTNDWFAVASSADGTRLAAEDSYFGVIYTSADSGTTWAMSGVPNWEWSSIALSADGTKMVASASDPDYNEYIFVSSDSGATWISNNVPGSSRVYVASSADGTKLVAAANLGSIFTSTNSGTTWQTNSGPITGFLYSVASSADGTKLVTGGGNSGIGYIFTSTNSGASWISNNVPGINSVYWSSVASSADGTKLMAVATSSDVDRQGASYIFTSTNSGTSWIQAEPLVKTWSGVASSADGCKLVGSAVAERFSPFPSAQYGGIYTLQITPIPWLNIASLHDNLVLSWLVPSTNFVLRQNLDLTTTNWVTLTKSPTLNLTNLQNQVLLSPSNSSGFYRLATP
jgi:hypothetical protein